MKNVVLVLALILFLSCVITSEPESSTNQELFMSRRVHPRFFPMPHWPFRGPREVIPQIPAAHFLPTPFHLPEEVTRCLSDKMEVKTCFDDIVRTLFTRKPATGSECCDAIMKMNKDCEKVFGSFHYPFLNDYVKLYCPTVIGSSISPTPSPSPSPTSSPALSPFPSPSPSLAH